MRAVRVHAFLGAVALMGLTACGPSHTGETYNRAEMQRAGAVSAGRIVAIEEAPIEGSSSGIGTVGGGVAGAVAGSAIGSGRGSILAGVGGAIIGAVVGNAVERSVTSGKAVRFYVQQENGQLINVVQTNEANLQINERVLIVDGGGKTRLTRDTGAATTPPAPR